MNTLNKKIFSIFIFALVIAPAHDAFALTEEKIRDLTRPAVVEVRYEISGAVQIPIVAYDAGTNRFSVVPEEALLTGFDETLSSLGFVVNPDGIVAADAVLFYEETLREKIAEKFLNQVFDIGSSIPNSLLETIKIQGRSLVAKNISFAEKKETIRVFGPIFPQGVNASIITTPSFTSVPILLSLPKKNLPSLEVEDSSKGGLYMYTSEGVSSSLKQNFSLKIVSLGKAGSIKSILITAPSYGSPIFDENGKVFGMSGIVLRKEIGNPPISSSEIEKILKEKKLESREGGYNKVVKDAFSLMEEARCKGANKLFRKAKEETSVPVESFLDHYISQCNSLIEDGKSKDTIFGFFRSISNALGILFPLLIGIAFFAVFAFTRGVRRILQKKESQKIPQDKNNRNDNTFST